MCRQSSVYMFIDKHNLAPRMDALTNVQPSKAQKRRKR